MVTYGHKGEYICISTITQTQVFLLGRLQSIHKTKPNFHYAYNFTGYNIINIKYQFISGYTYLHVAIISTSILFALICNLSMCLHFASVLT